MRNMYLVIAEGMSVRIIWVNVIDMWKSSSPLSRNGFYPQAVFSLVFVSRNMANCHSTNSQELSIVKI